MNKAEIKLDSKNDGAVAGTYTQKGSSPTTSDQKIANEHTKTPALESREFESLPGYQFKI